MRKQDQESHNLTKYLTSIILAASLAKAATIVIRLSGYHEEVEAEG
jgi:hypothetical protein